jgi:hypothetical protein
MDAEWLPRPKRDVAMETGARLSSDSEPHVQARRARRGRFSELVWHGFKCTVGQRVAGGATRDVAMQPSLRW